MREITVFETAIGNMRLCVENDAVTELSFTAEPVSGIENEAARQIKEYFAGTRRSFDLKLEPKGTAFQKRVWHALAEIPYGETRSYGAIAAEAGSPRGYRAVGMANNRNPIVIIIPCHRVIGSDGKLVGYAGGLDKKTFLLELEETNKVK